MSLEGIDWARLGGMASYLGYAVPDRVLHHRVREVEVELPDPLPVGDVGVEPPGARVLARIPQEEGPVPDGGSGSEVLDRIPFALRAESQQASAGRDRGEGEGDAWNAPLPYCLYPLQESLRARGQMPS